MEARGNDGRTSERDLYLRISAPTPFVDDSLIATLFVLDEVHLEGTPGSGRLVVTFDYVDPSERRDLADEFSVSPQKAKKQRVSPYLQIYGHPGSVLGLLSSASGSRKERPAVGIYLPGTGGEGDEYLQVSLDEVEEEGELVHLYLDNYATVKREDEVEVEIDSLADSEDLRYIFERSTEMAEQLSKKGASPSQLLRCSSAREMVEKLLGLERLDGGFVKLPREGAPKMLLSARRMDWKDMTALARACAGRTP
jgi:hypothetical protein